MNLIRKLHIALTIVLAVSLLVVIKCCTVREDTCQDEHATNEDSADTVVIFKRDTVTKYKVEYKDKIVKDTIYIGNNKNDILILVQKHFSNVGMYDVWVSGIEPLAMDSIKVYQNTEYKYITQTNTIRSDKGTDIYGTVGFSRFNDVYSSNIGIYATTNRKWLYGAEIGLINNKWYVGAKFGFKINNK